MTKFDNFKSKSIDELVEWLDKYGAFDNSPWTLWFDRNYCRNCEDVVCRYEDDGREFACAWCELNGCCKFFPEQIDAPDNKQIIKLWLESEEDQAI